MPPQPPFPDEDRVLAQLAELARGGWSHDSRVFAQALFVLFKRINIIMTTLADIKTALVAQGDKLTALAQRITDQANSGAPDPAALQAIADELNAHNASIDALDVPAAVAAVSDEPPAPTT